MDTFEFRPDRRKALSLIGNSVVTNHQVKILELIPNEPEALPETYPTSRVSEF